MFRQTYLLLLFVATCTLSRLSVSGATVDVLPLADCPKEPEVVGFYYNNGNKCVRDARVKELETIPVQCSDGYTLTKSGFCKKPTSIKKLNPSCPEGYKRGGKLCYRPCPDGFNRSKGKKIKDSKCEMPRDTLNVHYMTCPGKDQHRVGANCCSSSSTHPSCLVQCQVQSVPGTFLYKDGKCVRRKHVVARSYKLAERNAEGLPTCPPFQDLVAIYYCQDACPSGYLPTKGKCTLYPCKIRPGAEDPKIQCPEGSYQLPSTQM